MEHELNYKPFREQLKPHLIQNFKIDLLRIICNIIHIYKDPQNFILDNGYLILCLSFTVMDENNQLQKEWTVVLIRNLTESNERAMKLISELNLIDMTETSKKFMKKFKDK